MSKNELINIIGNLIDGFVHGKTIDDLYEEIQSGDCQLELRNNIPCRIVNVGFVRIFNNRRELIEIEQKFKNTNIIKNRNQPVGGKLRHGYNPKDELIREIKEELNIDAVKYQKDIQFIKIENQSNDSPYYPGIPAYWKMFHYKWNMPDNEVKEFYIEDDGKKITTFKWI